MCQAIVDENNSDSAFLLSHGILYPKGMGAGSFYTASMPEAMFILHESRQIAGLMLEYQDRDYIKELVHSDNLLNVKSKSNEDKIFGFTYNRLDLISDRLKQVLIEGSDMDSRYVNLISIMAYDRLFCEFVFEVYYDHLLSGDTLTDYDIMSFLQRKGREDETVASWKDSTLNKLRCRYSRILFSAGLVDKSVGIRNIRTPFVSRDTLDLLIDEGYRSHIKATLGIS